LLSESGSKRRRILRKEGAGEIPEGSGQGETEARRQDRFRRRAHLHEIQFGPPHSQKLTGVGVHRGVQPLRSLPSWSMNSNKPPFVVTNNVLSDQGKGAGCLELRGGRREKGFHHTRFKGPGRNERRATLGHDHEPETRTLLQVKLEDAVAAEDIFTNADGEKREARRKSTRKMLSKSSTWIFDSMAQS